MSSPQIETDDRHEITATSHESTASWVDELPLLAMINRTVTAVLSITDVAVETIVVKVEPAEQTATAPRPSSLLRVTASAKIS